MLGIGHFPELIIVLVIALIVFGPGKLPEIGRSLGKGLRGFQQASKELQSTLNGPFEDINAPITSAPASTPQAGPGTVPVTTVEHLPNQSGAGGQAHVSEHASASAVVPVGATVVKAEDPEHAGASAPLITAAGSSVAPLHAVDPSLPHEHGLSQASTESTIPVPPSATHPNEPGTSATARSTPHSS
ncbi:MAG: hypothetical protein NVSMB52_16240 [Chloroflexota bacterium]